MLDEIDELWQIANRPGAEPTNYSKGIYQSIGMHSFSRFSISLCSDKVPPLRAGYKEFEPYLFLKHRDPTRTLENDAELRRLFEQGLQEMKSSTRHYAKRQVKWIKTKLLPEVRASGNGEVEVFLLDASGERL